QRTTKEISAISACSALKRRTSSRVGDVLCPLCPLWLDRRAMSSVPRITRVGVVAKHHLRQAAPHLADITIWLKDHGLQAVFETATAALCSPACDWPVRDKEALVKEVDIVLVLGGDGTLLGMA